MSSTPRYDSALMWFRRDLRAYDNAALYHALRASRRVWCVFVFDTAILTPLLQRGLQADRRVEFIHAALQDLDDQLRALGRSFGTDGVGLIVLHAAASEAIPQLAAQLGVQAVYANHDDDPDALARDARVLGTLAHQGVAMHTFKDHVIFERREILTGNGRPFTVFTPYKNAWLRALTPFHLKAYPVERYGAALAPRPAHLAGALPSLGDLGFAPTNLRQLPMRTGTRGARAMWEDFQARLERYHLARDYPGIKGPSYLSAHLRFGTLSIREVAASAYALHARGQAGASAWLNELIWRDFYHQILANFPHIVEHAFKPEYDRIVWERGRHAEALLAAWCTGQTGYPLVDAAMRQLNQTGYMHNRLRMVVASFLTKDLGLDWRRGERYFADHLLDFDLAANNGGWQWAASSGCDAQPYFRIFNPVAQSRKFDPHGKFIRRYVPELAALDDQAIHAPWEASAQALAAAGVTLGRTYPLPIVDHAQARQRTLQRYAVVKAAR
ncbi:MAG: DNA photolyase family protein [Tepidimonas sp.]|nr:DNA photolyase family protein [Tepidimonas sp.]